MFDIYKAPKGIWWWEKIWDGRKNYMSVL